MTTCIAREQIRASEEAWPIPGWDIDRHSERKWILDFAKPCGVGAEIGVFRGCFTEVICATIKPRKLYLIDPWRLQGEKFGWGKEYTAFGELRTEAALQETQLRASLYPDTQSVIIEGWFPICSTQITDTLDWAYLDASHSREDVLRDLEHLAPLIREDGVILGDDWMTNPEAVHHVVFRAVHEFIERGEWELIRAGRGAQWAIRRRL